MNKKHTIIAKGLLLAALCIAPLSDMLANQADVVKDARIEWFGSERLKVSFPVSVGDVKLSTNDRVVVKPVLRSAEGEEMALPMLEFAGKQNKKYFDRKAVLDKTERLAVYAADDTVEYMQEIAVEPWMRKSDLKVVMLRDFEDCCSVTPIAPVTVAQTRYVEPVKPTFDPVIPHISVAERLAATNPIMIPMDQYEPYNPDVPLRKMKNALYVHFQVNKSNIDTSYRDNKATLDRILDLLAQVKADTLSEVKKVRLIGLASAEGPVEFNKKLSEKRAVALKDYLINNGAELDEDAIELIAGGEAWADLLDVIAESDLEGRDELLKQLRNAEDPNNREVLLRRHNSGKSYRYLVQSVFADQRNSGYIQVYYEAVVDTAANTINEAVGLLQQGKAAEAAAMLEPLDDNRKWNAYGSSLYMLDRKQEALEAFKKGVEWKNDGAEENLKAIQATM